jgi:hypothetical protein
MWSLPNIAALNEQAERDFKAKKKRTLKGRRCEFCGDRAAVALDYYDVFGPHPKGQVYLCKHHNEMGYPEEDYFTCDDCQKLFIENYTWENYFHCTEDGEKLCLNCHFDREIEDPENWITDLKQVTWERVRHCKHLIPVQGEHWKERLIFLGTAEFDSMTGEGISGGGLDGLREIVRDGLKDYGRVIPILDAAYQFAVSIGMYIEKGKT